MNKKTLNARISIIDGLKNFKSLPYQVPITGDLLKLARTAHRSYHLYLQLDEQKRIAKEKTRSRSRSRKNVKRRKKLY